ncbi:PQQ-binding-like beta-propeller repeat protein [Streptomyces sp. YC504]|uniref:PQQ-binding-like beta-propeller repeat protein n=1 Tax=Streptomyces mesophilus TaxID=1775132 RepID=A0A6G4XVU4_9ACTN|nr:PQQ-binding-like beta-propeller repeat protein [Streptomyces mesophilus]NGO81302.1 PQQ-binding-like beta-propeller repeat protein [Streptomyces mesophilus]
MSQPPQPPGPPSGPPGGFGGPQQQPGTPPPPAGQPPAQPGYGYPQGPPADPSQSGPYAQQPGPYAQQPGPYAQQPGPYGQPAGPYQQPGPGYGYPQQAQYPGAPAPGGPGGPGGQGGQGGGFGRFFKGKPGAIVAAVVAGLLVIGGGAFFLVRGDDKPKEPVAKPSADGKKDPQPSESVDQGDGKGTGKQDASINDGIKDGEVPAWLAMNGQDVPGNGAELFDIWTQGDVVVQAAYREVTAFSVKDGKEKWSVELPFEVCDTPKHQTPDGKVVIAHKSGTSDRAKCSQLMMIDLKTGKEGWTKEVKAGGAFDSVISLDLVISGDTLLAGRDLSGVAYRVSDGKEIWQAKKEDTGVCFPTAYAGGKKLLGVDHCGASSPNEHERLKEFDPGTGKVKWRYEIKKGWSVNRVYSESPIVVSLTNDEDKSWSIAAFTDAGKLRSQLQGGKDSFRQQCGGLGIGSENSQSCDGMVAGGDTFYMATEPKKSGDYNRVNEVVAFDLATGKPKWRSKVDNRQVLPLTVVGSDLIGYVDATYDTGGQIVKFGPNGGKPTVLQKHSSGAQSVESSMFSGPLAYADGRFFMTSSRLMGDDGEEEARMLSFGK